MNGTLYAIGEILVFLILATAIGFLLGRVLRPRREPAVREIPEDVAQLETKMLVLEGQLAEANDKLADAMAESRILRAQLEVSNSSQQGPEST